MTGEETVDAVLIKRHIGECPDCEGPLLSISDRIELGTIFKIRPSTRRPMAVTTHGREFKVEAVERTDGSPGEMFPAEALNWPGKT